MKCEGRNGFLTLSDCPNPPVRACDFCARQMCTAHLAPQSGFTKCLDCAVNDPSLTADETEHDSLWASRYRNSYYSSTGYQPVYGRTYFDAGDSRSFHDRQRDWGEDETDRGGFGAS